MVDYYANNPSLIARQREAADLLRHVEEGNLNLSRNRGPIRNTVRIFILSQTNFFCTGFEDNNNNEIVILFSENVQMFMVMVAF